MLEIITPAASADLVTVEAVKAELRITGSGDDDWLEATITQASTAIARWCGQTFGRETLQQTERPCWPAGHIPLDRYLAPSITSVTVDGDTLDPADYEIDGSLLYRLSDGRRVAWRHGVVVVLYEVGFDLPDDAPADLQRAAMDMVATLHASRGRDPMLRSEEVEGIGSASYATPSAATAALSPSVQAMLAPWRTLAHPGAALMPWAAPRFCAKPGHPRFTGARCPLCTQAFRQAQDARRPSAAQRGYDGRWQAFRAEYLRTHPTCCAPGCTATATEVDHITPIRAGGARLDPANVRAMCKRHHSQRTARDQSFGRAGSHA